MDDEFPTLLISLEKDRERRQNARKQLGRVGIAPHTVSAVNAHDKDFDFKRYRHLSRGRWWDLDQFKPGAFGCFLSHAECWRQVRDGEASYALICEDDLFVDPIPFANLMQAEFPADFDIIFVNAGVVRFLEEAFPAGDLPDEVFVPVDLALQRLVALGAFTDLLTPGAYGYFVSQAGAIKLLDLMSREKVCMGVDYAMIFGSLTDSDLKHFGEFPLESNYLRIYLENCEQDSTERSSQPRIPLRSYIWNGSPPIRHPSEFESSINHRAFRGFDVFESPETANSAPASDR